MKASYINTSAPLNPGNHRACSSSGVNTNKLVARTLFQPVSHAWDLMRRSNTH